MHLPPEPRELTPEEQQAVEWIRENGKRCQIYTIKDGKAVEVVDEELEKKKLTRRDIAKLFPRSLFELNDDDKESLTASEKEELSNKKLYGKNEIMELLQCGNQKALNFLKLLYQMKYAIKVGKSYLIKAEDFDRFYEDFKGHGIKI